MNNAIWHLPSACQEKRDATRFCSEQGDQQPGKKTNVGLNLILPSLPFLSCTGQCTSGKETRVVCWDRHQSSLDRSEGIYWEMCLEVSDYCSEFSPVSEDHRLKNKVTAQPRTPHHKVNRKEYSCVTNKN